MLRFGDALRWALTAVSAVVSSALVAVFSDLGKELLSKVPIAEMPWFYPAIYILIGLTAGVWAVWLLSQFDGQRAQERKQLGRDFLALESNVERAQEKDGKNWPRNLKFGEVEACTH